LIVQAKDENIFLTFVNVFAFPHELIENVKPLAHIPAKNLNSQSALRWERPHNFQVHLWERLVHRKSTQCLYQFFLSNGAPHARAFGPRGAPL